MSGRVGSAISKLGNGRKCGGRNRVSISFHSKAVSTSGFVADHQPLFEFPMSGNVDSNKSESGMVANVGVAVGIASPSLSVQKLFLLPV